MTKLSRRALFKMGLVGGGALLFPLAQQNSAWADAQTPRFQAPLRILPVLKPVHRDDLFDYYEITMQKRRVKILPDQSTEVWSYNGMIPGPLIRQPKLRQSVVRFINKLGQDQNGNDIDASIHLHGMASKPAYDGYSEDLIHPNYYKDYYYPNNRASTLWYHDHAVHHTSRNVYMGLAGMYVVEYACEDFYDPADCNRLPQGDYEVPLIIQDKRFAADGSLVFDDRGQRGVYEDVILVNGVPFPYMEVDRRKYRFRLLNASASRTYQLALSRDQRSLTKGDKLTVIACDAGLLNEPVELTAPYKPLQIGVAERYEFIIDFSQYPSDTTQLYLRNLGFSGNLGSESPAIMRFDLKDPVSDDSIIPKKLGKVTPIQTLVSQAVRTRTFRFERNGGQWKINNQTWNENRVDANPDLNQVEIWNLVNAGGWTHPVHIHLVDLQIIDRNGALPALYERGWKDVFVLSDLETVRVVAKFGPHRGKYMMHCHNIVHEDHDMMTQFEVGQGGSSPKCDPPKPLPAPSLGSTPPLEQCLKKDS